MVLGRVLVPARVARDGTESKTSWVRIYRRGGVDHPSGHDVGFGSAGLVTVTDLPPSTFAFVLADKKGRLTVQPSPPLLQGSFRSLGEPGFFFV